ncbi:ribokinase [Brevibacterium album]|uniref:ribokinase n=1 Tax=Brevibacterium album TaxID=417948 RepID=UPI00040EADD9|nr:ribokinase [Brevibacterium album]
MSAALVVFGSVNRDLGVRVRRFPLPGETLLGHSLSQSPGGKSANQAAAAALSGAATALIGRVGRDEAGEQVTAALRACGVDTADVRATGSPTGTALITVDEAGENTIVMVPGANADVTGDDCPDARLQAASWTLLGMEVPLAAVFETASRARAAGCRVALNLSPVPEAPVPLEDIDLLVVNRGEAEALLEAAATGAASPDTASPPDLEAAAEALGVDTVAITLGAGGVLLSRQERPAAHIPTPTVRAVDTTGCGDAFAGVLVGRLACGDDLELAAQRATGFAARAATAHGAMQSYPRDHSW